MVLLYVFVTVAPDYEAVGALVFQGMNLREARECDIFNWREKVCCLVGTKLYARVIDQLTMYIQQLMYTVCYRMCHLLNFAIKLQNINSLVSCPAFYFPAVHSCGLQAECYIEWKWEIVLPSESTQNVVQHIGIRVCHISFVICNSS